MSDCARDYYGAASSIIDRDGHQASVTERPVALSPLQRWHRVVLQKVSEQVTECLRRAAESDARAEVTDDAKNKIEYRRMANSWRTLARSYEFQGSLGRFVSFNKERQNAFSSLPGHTSNITACRTAK
jgi:hypothetical protein